MRGSVQSTLFIAFLSLTYGASAQSPPLPELLQPLLRVVQGAPRFDLEAAIELRVDQQPHEIQLRAIRYSDEAFDLTVQYQDDTVFLGRTGNELMLALPRHKVCFVASGEVTGEDSLRPAGLAQQLISSGTELASYYPLVVGNDARTLATILQGLLQLQPAGELGGWRGVKGLTLTGTGPDLRISQGETTLRIRFHEVSSEPEGPNPNRIDFNEFQRVELPRAEFERTVVRGIRRALEIVLPGPTLVTPKPLPRQTENGELRWIEGHRVVLLRGTPEEIGKAHGALIKPEAQRCIDSVLHTFGLVQTVRTGRWFRHDLEQAHQHLAAYIPERHVRETHAMADALGIDRQTCEVLNVFPELFHCSGFAVFGKATVGGKLYHGRVLDYMTMIGLQDAATTFIIQPEGHHAFVNVGYAGFIGSVTGMNDQAISLGEMGGRGEGQWDGAPMATLMRRGLEECSSLTEVMDLWKNSPRTCEYYYVFADGKNNTAVGVAATPENVQFVFPGEEHPLLGEGIEDAVVLSAGDRLETLRKRVRERYGTIDAEAGQWLMSRPVAMKSNLHNVLFVPADGVLYVANASHRAPAAEQPYVRLDLRELLQSFAVQRVSEN